MKRFISLFLLLAVCVCGLSSCSKNFPAASALAKAEKELTENTYTVNMSMSYACDDAVTDIVFNAFILDAPAKVNGETIFIDMSAETMGTDTGVVLTVADKVLYYDSTLDGKSTKQKTLLQGDALSQFMQDMRIKMPVGVNDFDTLTVTTVNDKQVVTCSNLTPEGAATMVEMISAPLSLLSASATVKSLTMVATIAYEKYETVTLTATFYVTAQGVTHEVDLTMIAHYDYTDVDIIRAPADADSYTWVTYETIMG